MKSYENEMVYHIHIFSRRLTGIKIPDSLSDNMHVRCLLSFTGICIRCNPFIILCVFIQMSLDVYPYVTNKT